MATFFSKANVKTAVQSKKNRFSLDKTHITTLDFFKPKCAYSRELMPGQSIDIDMSAYCKFSGVRFPFFGDAKLKCFAFFVPFRTIMEGFNNFLEDTPYSWSDGTVSTPSIVPTVTTKALIETFTNSRELTEMDPNGAYDFQYQIANEVHSFVLTEKGKVFWDILQTLGYKLTTIPFVDRTRSALPLLAWCKIFVDWFINPAYSNYVSLNKFFKGKKNSSFTSNDVMQLLNMCHLVHYKSDYFTSCWDEPNQPNTNNGGIQTQSSISLKDPTNNTIGSDENNAYQGYINSYPNGTPNTQGTPHMGTGTAPLGNNVVYGNNITQWMLNALHKVTDYVKRHQLVGSRLLDRYMADWGIQLDSAKLDRCLYIGRSITNVAVAEIQATAQANAVAPGNNNPRDLGSFSGNARAVGKDHFKYTADEFGMLIIVTYFEPHVMYVDGVSKFMNHGVNGRFDFFTPMLDNMGMFPVIFEELSTNLKQIKDGSFEYASPTAIFGFQNKYAEYASEQDMLSGDFTLNSKNTLLDSWFMARRYRGTDIEELGLQQKHNNEFTTATPETFKNIFISPEDDFDKIYAIFRFNVTSYMPKKTLFDVYDFEDDGKNMLLTMNGTTVTD